MAVKFSRVAWVLSLVLVCFLATACGKGKTYKYPGMELAPDPTDPYAMAVYPMENGKASVSGKTVVFNAGGEVPDYIFGGVSDDAGVVVSDNQVTINGGKVDLHAYGAYSTYGKALNNTLIINDGEMMSAFAGGSGLESSGNTLIVRGGKFEIDRDGDSVFAGYAWDGSTNNNTLEVSGGYFPGDIYAGWARSGTATGNTVRIEGDPVIEGAVYAGYLDYGLPGEPGQDAVTGNKIFIKNFSGKIPMLRNAELVSIEPTATVIFPEAYDVAMSGVSRLLNDGTVALAADPVVWENITYFGTGRILWRPDSSASLTLDTGILEAPLRLEVDGQGLAPFKDKPVIVLVNPVFSKGMDPAAAVQLVNDSVGGLSLGLKRVQDGGNDVWMLSAQ